MHGYQASKVDSLKPRKYIHSGVFRDQIPTSDGSGSEKDMGIFPQWSKGKDPLDCALHVIIERDRPT
jgi:hypothetical protein